MIYPLSVRKYRQKISQNIEDLNHTLEQPDLTFIEHQTTAEYAFYMSVQELFTKMKKLGEVILPEYCKTPKRPSN